jgi:RNA polymerase sigma-70 factor (ECF subfamily)
MSTKVADVLWEMHANAGVKRCHGIVGDALFREEEKRFIADSVETIHRFEAVEHDGEHTLVLQAQNGSDAAFELLVKRYDMRIFRVAQNITRHRQDAEDVVQNAFANAFKYLPLFREDSRFYTWLVRITVNEALKKIRCYRVNEVSIDELLGVGDALIPREIQDWRPNPELCYSQQELKGILTAAINQLESGYRIVFELRAIDGLSTEETAQTLGMTSTVVRARLHRARLRLRTSLDRYFRPMDARSESRHWVKVVTQITQTNQTTQITGSERP